MSDESMTITAKGVVIGGVTYSRKKAADIIADKLIADPDWYAKLMLRSAGQVNRNQIVDETRKELKRLYREWEKKNAKA